MRADCRFVCQCIDRLRYVAWGNINPTNETSMVSQKHTGRFYRSYILSSRFAKFVLDHCIDYLRQAIMCHGDTTPMPLKIVTDHYGLPFYDTDWNVHHTVSQHAISPGEVFADWLTLQCRSFESIYEWATIHNTTGLHI
jgi:hypothetical protein